MGTRHKKGREGKRSSTRVCVVFLAFIAWGWPVAAQGQANGSYFDVEDPLAHRRDNYFPRGMFVTDPNQPLPQLAVKYPQTSFHDGEFYRVVGPTDCQTYPDRVECEWKLDASLEAPEDLSGGRGRVVDLDPAACNVLELWSGVWSAGDQFTPARREASVIIRMARDVIVVPVVVHSFLLPGAVTARVFKNLFDKTGEIDALLGDYTAYPEPEWEWARMPMDSAWAQCGVQFRFHGFVLHTPAPGDTPSVPPFPLYGAQTELYECCDPPPIPNCEAGEKTGYWVSEDGYHQHLAERFQQDHEAFHVYIFYRLGNCTTLETLFGAAMTSYANVLLGADWILGTQPINAHCAAHELGHLLTLFDVTDPGNLMRPGEFLATELNPEQCCKARRSPGEAPLGYWPRTFEVHLDCTEPLEGQPYQDCLGLAGQGEPEPWQSVYTHSVECETRNPCADADDDGLWNVYDCEPGNPHMKWDVDTDEICEGTWDLTDCTNACDVYTATSKHDECVSRCEHPDNCPWFDSRSCIQVPPDRDWQDGCTAWDLFCNDHRHCLTGDPRLDCETTQQADLCHMYFANRGQEDGDGNGRGDHCESTPRGHVKLRDAPDRMDLGSDYACYLPEQFDVEILLEGGPVSFDFGLHWGEVPQRTMVGACGCTEAAVLFGWCDTSQVCPVDVERDQWDNLAWAAIRSGQAGVRNVGYHADTCPTCPKYVEEPSYGVQEPTQATAPLTFLRHVINKYLKFTRRPGANEHYFSWLGSAYEKDLVGTYVRVRVAWQDPEIGDHYGYFDAAPYKVGFSDPDDRKLVEPVAYPVGCFQVPWKIPGPLGGPSGPGEMDQMTWLAIKPLGWTNHSPIDDPSPLALFRDQVSQDRYVGIYAGRQIQLSNIRVVEYGSGEHILNQSGSAVAVGWTDTEVFEGLQHMSKALVIYYFGGIEPTGELSNALWFGFPTHERNLFLRAEEIYGPRAAEGPLLIRPKAIYHPRGERLVVAGSRAVYSNGLPELRSELWTFELRTGRWRRGARLRLPITRLTMNVDPIRNRAVIFGGKPEAKTYNLNLDTLVLTEIETTPAEQGPTGDLIDHGAHLEPVEQALYVYGGRYNKTPSLKAFRLDLLTRQWSYLGEGSEGPGPRHRPFVSYDRVTRTLWVAGGVGSEGEPGIVFWGLRNGEWFRHDTMREIDLEGWVVEGRYDPYIPSRYPVYVPDTEPYTGKLLLAHLHSSDPNLGLEVKDSQGNVVGSDLAAGTDNYVAFYAHSVYMLEVVPGPGLDPEQHPEFTVTVSEAALAEVGSYTGSEGVNDLLVRGDVAYLVGTSGMDAVSLGNPTAPQPLGHLDLKGFGRDVELCGRSACVAKTRQGKSLKTVDISDPASMQVLGQLQTPGVSRTVGVKGHRWVYLSDGGAGVSIIDATDPADPRRVDGLVSQGVVTTLAVSANRLYVANMPQNRVRIYEVTGDQSPVLLGEFQLAGKAEAMVVNGTLLHVAEYTGQGWQQCISGGYCPPGTAVEVFDISDPAAVLKVGDYDGEQNPAVHMKTYRNHGLVRTYNGFTVYRVVPLL